MAKKQAKKQAPQLQKSDVIIGLISAGLVYSFASWAIESGSIWAYLFTYIAIYYTVYYLGKSIKTTVKILNARRKNHTA